ncbi:MAG TPA: glycoside hydrolase family 16 protein [Chitinophagaceae bacterium]|nr:glycoside hydrolase family 16 protein [Chitinophagaceae bacterium]
MKPTIIIALCSVFISFSFSRCKKQLISDGASQSQVSTSRNSPENNSTTVSAHAICDYVLDEAALTSAGWIKVFEDDFTSDLSKWNIWTGGAYNNELQYYQAANLQVFNGNLVITANKETVTGATTPSDPTPKTFNYTSGRIECKTNVSAKTSTPKVRMIARIKLPAGYGMWPAYWSYGDPWPTQGEIDFLEARGQEPTKYQTNYFYGKVANHNIVKNSVGYINTDGDLTSCYHVYEMIWAQNTLTSYFDGQLVETKSGGNIPNLFGKTERITLNLAVGGNFFTNFDPTQIQTGSMYVDYVKVFTSN